LDVLQSRAGTALRAEHFAAADQRFVRTADLRYFGQAFEVRVPLADGDFTPAVADRAVAAFHDAHEQLYGYCFRDRLEQQVEWVNLRITGVGPIRRPDLRRAPATGTARPTGERPVCFDAGADYAPTSIYWRPDLPAGAVVTGPAVIEEYGATVPLHPGFTAAVDGYGNLVVERKDALQPESEQEGRLPYIGARS
ncbi:MAG: hypothetical protein L0Y54_22190, partial [Sporichthyaceae bacterium]|nr:hypothetical protein [Sporichthyaceae bacterium]